MTEREKQVLLLKYRLAYVNESHVNWCPALGTVLSNDEVKDGFSERGGHPVIKKKMPQWSMRITAYAERLLRGLETIEWPEPIKEMQRNWIGKSVGAELDFSVAEKNMQIRVFTTRLDTIYGVTFLTLAPESDIVSAITTEVQRPLVEAYIQQAIHKSEKDRMSDVKSVSGVFTGSYALHPFTKESIPIWVADYVLSGYGTGVVMGVPCSDTRDYAFAKHFSLPIIPVLEGETADITKSNFIAKSGKMIHSQDLNGMEWGKALVKITAQIEQMHIGKQKINYKMRDAIFGRQRYWGEPIPIYYKDGIPYVLDNTALPLTLPEVNAYLPTEYGEPPLARAMDFKTQDGNPYEYTTMPGWAGSSWYFFRYMDPHNEKEFCSKEAQRYWQKVDLYLGGAEHATGHLLYSRFWTKFLYDKGFVNVDEYAQKLVNQGMIQGRSNFVYRVVGENTFVSFHLIQNYKTTPLHVDVNMVENDVLDIEKFKNARAEAKTAQFILEDDKYICGWEVEKMSKSKLNVVNPDDIIEKYGADTLRLYEMFLGPLEQFKPWNTNGIEGVHKFLKKLWKFFVDENSNGRISLEKPNPEELKILHKTIKKASEDIERLSFNTSVSAFMICLNELIALKCNKKEILEPFILLIAPYTPHIAEELWYLLGNKSSVTVAPYPLYNPEYVQEDSFEYPIAINGKTRTKILFSLDIEATAIEKQVIENESVLKWTDGKKIKKIIIMKGKIINIVTD
ncbi:MAG: leucine--tRNA ligase [Chitinophagaceae bacterium]|nr:leucine--tRNA ligase [Chitinophagaceae bacterium]